MKNVPKFDIKLSFTGKALKGNNKLLENSLLLEKLFNKKINIHLKINLDKLEQQYTKQKQNKEETNLDEEDSKDEALTNILMEEDSKKLIERNNKKVPIIKLEYNKGNLIKSKIFSKNNSRSVSNQKAKLINCRKNTLVLDLDETLVYVSDKKNEYLGLQQIPFSYYIFDESEKFIKENCKKLGITKIQKSTSFITIRPNFNTFINFAKKFFEEIVIFTSSLYSYAEEIIKIIDKKKIISKIYSRKDCSFYNDVFYKDLNKVKDDLSHIIIIDNYPESFLLQYNNGLPIPSFIGNSNDKELLKLMPILERLSKVKDVRNYIKQIIDINSPKINFNIAYQLLNIKSNNTSNIGKEEKLKKYYCIKKNQKVLKGKLYDGKSNNYMIKKKEVSEFIQNIENNSNVNVITKEKKNEIDEDENILVNDPNNYYYLEKNYNNNSSTSRNKNIFPHSKNMNSNGVRNLKKDKSENINQIKLSKSLCNRKEYKSLKPQVINSISINNIQNNLYNDYNIFQNQLNKDSKKIINDQSINPDCNIININPNISYFNNYNDSFFSQKQNINSLKKIINCKTKNKTNKKNVTFTFLSYNKKPKANNFIEKTKEKNLISINDITQKSYVTNPKSNNSDLEYLKNKTIKQLKKIKKIPIKNITQFTPFHDKKCSLSP